MDNKLPADVIASVNAELAEANQQVVAKVNGRDVTRGELLEAFKRVENKENWKLPIDATIDITRPTDANVIAEAITFFTGSVPEFITMGFISEPSAVPGKFTTTGVRVRVKAVGYYAAVGA